ncbi:hypothetical protein LTR85_002502 [Meristemomyces frigidus]|nr:hypothetical protein LTR85_002502 [Meristemomyces frigidus]
MQAVALKAAGNIDLTVRDGDSDKEISFDELRYTSPQVAEMIHVLLAQCKKPNDEALADYLYPDFDDLHSLGKSMWVPQSHALLDPDVRPTAFSYNSSILGPQSSKSYEVWPFHKMPSGFLACESETSGGNGPESKPEDVKAAHILLYGKIEKGEKAPKLDGTLQALHLIDCRVPTCKSLNLLSTSFYPYDTPMTPGEGSMAHESGMRYGAAGRALMNEFCKGYGDGLIEGMQPADMKRKVDRNLDMLNPEWLGQFFQSHIRFHQFVMDRVTNKKAKNSPPDPAQTDSDQKDLSTASTHTGSAAVAAHGNYDTHDDDLLGSQRDSVARMTNDLAKAPTDSRMADSTVTGSSGAPAPPGANGSDDLPTTLGKRDTYDDRYEGEGVRKKT